MTTRKSLKKSKKLYEENQNSNDVESNKYATTECGGDSEVDSYRASTVKMKKYNIDQKTVNQSGGCIEVGGRKTRLKKIKNPLKSVEATKYETEEFMRFSEKSELSSNPNNNVPAEEVQSYQTHTLNNIPIKVFVEPNKDSCNIPKQVVNKEYRLVMAKLNELKIVPPEVKVIIKDALFFPEATRKKLKQFHKSKRLKGLLPSSVREEIEMTVQNLNEQLQSKISMINTLTEIEENTCQLAQELSGKQSDTIQTEGKAGLEPPKIELLKKMSHQLQLLLEKETGDGNTSKASTSIKRDNKEDFETPSTFSKKKKTNFESNHCKSKDTTSEDTITTHKSLTQIKLEERLASLADQMKTLTEGKIPQFNRSLKSGEESSADWISRSFSKYSERSESVNHKESYSEDRFFCFGRGKRGPPPRSIFRGGRDGFFSHGHCHRRGAGGAMKASVPHGSWGAVQSCGRGFTRSFDGFTNYSARSQPYWCNQGFGGGRNFRGRGRISQNNFDAKQYANKCKAENKMPELNFKGVDLKNITGYAANVSCSESSKTEVKSSSVT